MHMTECSTLLQVPWTARCTHPKLSLLDEFVLHRVDRYLSKSITTGSIRILRPDGNDSTYGTPGTSTARPAVVPAFPTPTAFEIGSIATAGAAKSPESCFGALDSSHPMVRVRDGAQNIPVDVFVRVLDVHAFTRVAMNGSVGLLHAYKQREIEVSDVGALAAVLMKNTKGLAAHEGALGVLQWMGSAMLYAQCVHEHEHVDSGCISAELQVDQLGACSSAQHMRLY
jgi:hypothetical protein